MAKKRRVSAVAKSTRAMDALAGLLGSELSTELPTFFAAGDLIDDAGVAVGYERDDEGRLSVAWLLIVSERVTGEQLRKLPLTTFENAGNLTAYGQKPIEDLPPLRRKASMSSQEFSELVAAHYRRWALAVPRPALAMAEESGAKLPTVHTWIREARLRGLLPPAKRRRASD